MRVLLDECVHSKLKRVLTSVEVRTVPEAGWRGIVNGKLLALAATEYDVFITSDKNLEYQQHNESLPMPVIVISTIGNMWIDIEPIVPRIQELLSKPLEKIFYR